MAVDEVRPGYKRSEVGVIPENWDIRPLSELFELKNGVNADIHDYGRGTPFANVLEVITHPNLYVEQIPGRVHLPHDLTKRFVVQRGDVLFNRTSETETEIGLASVYLDEALIVFGGFVIRGRPKDDSFVPEMSAHCLRVPSVREQIIARGQGAIRSNIGQADLATVLVPVPSKPEQERIAESVADLSSMVSNIEALLEKKRDLKQAAMLELLTPKEHWRESRLDQLGIFLKGSGVPRVAALTGNLPCVRYGEIYTNHHFWINTFQSHISETVAETALPLKTGDLLFTGSGETHEEIGKCIAFLGNHRAYAGGDIVVLRPASGDSLFLSYLLGSHQLVRQKAALGQGDAVVHIGAAALATLKFSLPPVDEQSEIVSTLTDIDAEITALEARLTKYRDIQQGMMQQLLTGATRLI